MPSGGFTTRLRRKRRLRNHHKLQRINDRRVKVGMSRAVTLTQAQREWDSLRERETNVHPGTPD